MHKLLHKYSLKEAWAPEKLKEQIKDTGEEKLKAAVTKLQDYGKSTANRSTV